MSVKAVIHLSKQVKDLDKADDWFAKVKELLQGKTTCRMVAQSSNHETPIAITEEPEDG